MGYVACIDYRHLDNTLFLRSLASAAAKQNGEKITPRIFVHEDSEHTERLIQTGMMRAEARLRAIRELNRRLINLFADYGVAAIGLHGYQRKLITVPPDSAELLIDLDYLDSLPRSPVLVLSSLVHMEGKQEPQPFPFPRYLGQLQKQLAALPLYVFPQTEKPESNPAGEASHPDPGKKSVEYDKKTDKKDFFQELTESSVTFREITIDDFSHIHYNQ